MHAVRWKSALQIERRSILNSDPERFEMCNCNFFLHRYSNNNTPCSRFYLFDCFQLHLSPALSSLNNKKKKERKKTEAQLEKMPVVRGLSFFSCLYFIEFNSLSFNAFPLLARNFIKYTVHYWPFQLNLNCEINVRYWKLKIQFL